MAEEKKVGRRRERTYMVFRKSGDKQFVLLDTIVARNKKGLISKLKQKEITGEVFVTTRLDSIKV